MRGDYNYKLFLQRLLTARKEADLTQRQVTVSLGKPQSWLSKCESGERRIDILELAHLAVIYDKQLNFFLPSPSELRVSRPLVHPTSKERRDHVRI